MVEEVLESAVDESGIEQALPSEEEVLVVTEISEEEANDVDMKVQNEVATEEGTGGTELPAQQTVAVSS